MGYVFLDLSGLGNVKIPPLQHPGSQIGAIIPEAVTISRRQYATMTPVSPDATKVG